MIKAVARASAEERTFWQRVIEKGDQRPGDLERAVELLSGHGAIADTRSEAIMWAARAKEALAALPAHDLREMLSDLADYVVARVR